MKSGVHKRMPQRRGSRGELKDREVVHYCLGRRKPDLSLVFAIETVGGAGEPSTHELFLFV